MLNLLCLSERFFRVALLIALAGFVTAAVAQDTPNTKQSEIEMSARVWLMMF